MTSQPRVVVFGAGAVGATVGGWLAPHYENLFFYDLPAVRESLRKTGLALYQGDQPDRRERVQVRVTESLEGADVIVLAVKTYSLDAVARAIKDQVGDRAVIVALQNGVENQRILPRYFSRVIYGIVSYNAWIDEPGVLGYQKRGPLVLGTVENGLQRELAEVSGILNRGVETIVTDRLQDAARSKMVLNLTNSFATLVGHRFRKISNEDLFQKLLTNLTSEGVQIIRTAGYQECRLGGMPAWRTISLAAKLPLFLTRPIFNKNVKKMVLSSMAQDVLQHGRTDSELESLNGYFVRLADQCGLKAPYNRAVYELCREKFGKPGFVPVDVTEVWSRVQQKMRS